MSENLEFRYILNSAELGELVLDHNPVGWDAAENTLSRSEQLDGVFSNYTKAPLSFVASGYRYLKELDRLKGVAMKATITVKRWSNLKQSYTTRYVGVLNGKSFKEVDKLGGSIEINIGETTFQENLRARIDNVINYADNYAIDGVTPLTIPNPKYEDTMLFGQQKVTKSVLQLIPGFFQDPGGYQDHDYRYCLLDLSIVDAESNNDRVNDTFYGQIYNGKIAKIPDGGWIYNTDKKMTAKVKINGFIRINRLDSAQDGLRLLIYKGKKVLNVDESQDEPDFLSDLVKVYDQFEVQDKIFRGENDRNAYSKRTTTLSIENFTVELNSSEALLFLLDNSFTNGNPFDVSSNLPIRYCTGYHSSQYGPSYTPVDDPEMKFTLDITESPIQQMIPGILPFNLFERIIASITGQNSRFISNLLNDERYKSLILFNGYTLRGFDPDKYGFSISLSQLIDTYKILIDAGFGINSEGFAMLEDINEFYKDEVCLTIDNVTKETWTRELDPSMFFSSVEVGYDKTEYEEDGGMIEYNNRSRFSTPIDIIANELSLIPGIRGDGFGVSGALYLDVNSTDSRFDQELFFVDCSLVNLQGNDIITFKPFYAQRDPAFWQPIKGIDGITTPMNLDFTPARLAIRNSGKFTTGFDKYGNQGLKFNSMDVPNELSTFKTGDPKAVKEGVSIEKSQLKSARFSGYKISFNWFLDFETFSFLSQNRYCKIKVKNPLSGIYHYGWIKEITQNSLNESVNFILLESNNQTDPDRKVYLVDNNRRFIINDNGERMLING